MSKIQNFGVNPIIKQLVNVDTFKVKKKKIIYFLKK